MKGRSSNFELLRLFAMLMVLMVHASFKALGIPDADEIQSDPLSAFLRFFSESFSIIGVNVFVLISGWFGINPNLNRFCGLIFQVLFYWIAIYVFMFTAGLVESFDIYKAVDSLFKDSYWFVWAYVILYIFAPVLNSFVENVPERNVFLFIMFFYVFQTLFDFVMYTGWFSNGYSPWSFMGLYVLARYLHKYPSCFFQNRLLNASLYFLLLFFLSIWAMLFSLYSIADTWKLYSYSSPFVVLLSLSFFYLFVGIRLASRIVNYVASSCLSVYLVHTHPLLFGKYYLQTIENWFLSESRFCFLLYVFLFMTIVCVISILLDNIRRLLWQGIKLLFFPN